MELVNSKNKAIHLENHEDKWNNLKELVNKTLDDLETIYIEAQEQALRKWFDEVAKSMETVEFRRSVKKRSDSPHYIDYPKKIPASI